MQITFLGTGPSQGIPIIGCHHPVCRSHNPKDKRLRSSIMVEWEHARYIIDTGPDFRQQMIAHDVDHVEAILFTHEHSDHVLGFDDIRPFHLRQKSIHIYAEDRVIDALKLRFAYFFDSKHKYPGAPNITIHPLVNKNFTIGRHLIVPIRVMHARLPIYGFRFGDFTYITDAKTVPEEELKKFEGTRILVVNALRKEEHHAHFNLEEAIDFIEQIKPEKAYLTHISHWMGFHDKVEHELPENIHLAYDNLKITLP